MPVRRPPLDSLDPLSAAQVRLKRVNRALALWDANEQGRRRQPEGLSRASLLNLQAMLEQVIREQRAEWRLRTGKHRN